MLFGFKVRVAAAVVGWLLGQQRGRDIEPAAAAATPAAAAAAPFANPLIILPSP